MSSYIVADKTINRIVTWIDMNTSGRDMRTNQVMRALKKIDITRPFNGTEELEGFANCFYRLNSMGVDDRYNEKSQLLRLKFQRVMSTDIQVLKSIQCLRYQCGEGDVPDNKLYKFLTELIGILQDNIIDKLPEYQKAEWD